MSKQGPLFEWRMLDEIAEAPPSSAIAPPNESTQVRQISRRARWCTLAAVLALFVPVLIEGYQELHRADRKMTRVEDEVRAAVAAEEWVQQPEPQTVEAMVASVREPAERPTLRVRAASHANGSIETGHAAGLEVRSIEVRGNYAMAEVWTHASTLAWLPASYRQTRFFHETAQGWLPTEPPDLFWQPQDTLHIGRFTFVYGPRDAAAVRAVAAQIEKVDETQRAELALSAADDPMTIRVATSVPSSVDPMVIAFWSLDRTFFAPSPALLPLPGRFSEGDALLQLVTGLLVTHNLQEALTSSSPCNWNLLTNSLRQWSLWEHSQLPSSTRETIERDFRAWLTANPHPKLAWFTPSAAMCSPAVAKSIRGVGLVDPGAAISIVDYAMSTYGRDHLPALIEGRQRYDSWEELVPAVFGVSAAEFEVAWQAYLLDQASDIAAAEGR